MAWRCSGSTNAALVNNLAASGLITSERVKRAMLRVDRAHFVPLSASSISGSSSSSDNPYADSPQPIGHAATISAPHMHAHAAETLLPYLNPGSAVLDVGSGSGYLTRVLAELVRPGGKVIGVDHVGALVDMAVGNVLKEGRAEEEEEEEDKDGYKTETGKALLESGQVRFVKGDGRRGCEAEAPFDAIHVGAAASELHGELVGQLKRPGRLFVPVEDAASGQQNIFVVDKKEDGSIEKKRLFGVMYVPLTDAPAGG